MISHSFSQDSGNHDEEEVQEDDDVEDMYAHQAE